VRIRPMSALPPKADIAEPMSMSVASPKPEVAIALDAAFSALFLSEGRNC
jgi:hypothetical protein